MVSKVFCVSEAVGRDLSPVVSKERLIVIPNWVRELPLSIKCHMQKERSFHLLFVGRLIKLKGVDLILKAISQIKDYRLLLTIVGNGEYEDDLKHRAENLNVHFAGFQKDPSSFYRNADLFINPTLGPEGLPMVSLEAMSYGIPCIFSDLQVHREITNDGESALLFRCGDFMDLRTKIEQLISSPQLMLEYSKRSRSIIERKYCATVAGSRYLKELEI